MSKTVAFLAGMGAGYLDAKDKNRRNAIEDERLAAEREDRAAKKAEREQTAADKRALRDAAAPASVESNMVDNIDMDQPGQSAPQPKVQDGYRVGAKTFAERGVADAAAAKANDPKAVRERVASTLAAQGNVLGADQLRTSGIQGEAAQMQLDAGKRAEANQLFDQELRKAVAKGPDALAQFLSDSHADGEGGATKFKAVMLPDGKSWQMHRVGEDGKLVPMANPLPNDENGMATAGLMLSRAVPEKDKVAHMMAVREAERRQKHDDASLKIAQQNADTNERYRRDQAENMRRQRELQAEQEKRIAAGKAKPGGPIQVDLKDVRDFGSDLNARIKDKYPVKDGADEAEKAALNSKRAAEEAMGTAYFRNNAALGIPLTAGTVEQAMGLASDRSNIKPFRAADGKVYGAVVVHGQPVVVTGEMQQRAPQQPGPTQATPASVAARGVAPAPPARPQAPVDRIGDAPIGRLTPIADLQEAAAAGNPRAIAYLREQASGAAYNETAPRDAASMLTGQ